MKLVSQNSPFYESVTKIALKILNNNTEIPETTKKLSEKNINVWKDITERNYLNNYKILVGNAWDNIETWRKGDRKIPEKFDAIHVGAEADEMPKSLLQILKRNGH